MVRAVSQRSGVRPVRTERAAGGDMWLILLIFLLSGAAGLIYEVVWSRLLMLALGAGAQSLAVAAAGTMLGLAAGSELGGRLADRRGGLRLFGVICVLIGLSAPVATAVLRAGTATFLPWPLLLLVIELVDLHIIGRSSGELLVAERVDVELGLCHHFGLRAII